jgi:hypothetical protein
MWRRAWVWLRRRETWQYVPELHQRVDRGTLADRQQAATLQLLTALDVQADQWPEDRDDQLIDLACDVLLTLGVQLQKPAPGEVPVIRGLKS